jgi:hypothetical protein
VAEAGLIKAQSRSGRRGKPRTRLRRALQPVWLLLLILIVAPLLLAGHVAMTEIVARWEPLRRWGRVATA